MTRLSGIHFWSREVGYIVFRQSMKVLGHHFMLENRERGRYGDRYDFIVNTFVSTKSMHTAERAKLSEEKLKPEHLS